MTDIYNYTTFTGYVSPYAQPTDLVFLFRVYILFFILFYLFYFYLVFVFVIILLFIVMGNSFIRPSALCCLMFYVRVMRVVSMPFELLGP